MSFRLKSIRLILTVILAFGVILVLDQSASAEDTSKDGKKLTPVQKGKRLFTGEKSFKNGGVACMACHSAGVGRLGGGTVARDLRTANADLISDGWVNNAIGTREEDKRFFGKSLPMAPVYKNNQVTEGEMSDVKAFILQQKKDKPITEKDAAEGTGAFVGAGIIGFVALLIILSGIWGGKGRFRSRNKGTAHEALWRNYDSKGGR